MNIPAMRCHLTMAEAARELRDIRNMLIQQIERIDRKRSIRDSERVMAKTSLNFKLAAIDKFLALAGENYLR